MKELVHHLKAAWYGLLIGLILVFLIMSAVNATTLAGVRIRLLEGRSDRLDKQIPFVTEKGDELPDYRAEYLLDDRWQEIGTIPNTSAKEWLEYRISDQPSFHLVQRVRIIEDDEVGDDPVDEVSVIDSTTEGSVFLYAFDTSYSLKAGMDWFATTILGKVIFGAIGLAIFLVVPAHLAA